MDVLTEGSPCCSVSSYLLLGAISLGLYFIYTKVVNRESWEKYGVKHISMTRVIFEDFRKAVTDIILKEGDTVGLNIGGLMLVTRDLDILRNVMVKDFNNFVDRSILIVSNSPLEKGLFFLNGQDWRRIRHVTTPSFSTGKLKLVTDFIHESSLKLSRVLEDHAREGKLVPIKTITGQFTSEIIARTAFSLNTDCLGKADDEFTNYAKNVFKVNSKFMNLIMLILFQARRLHTFLVKKCKLQMFDSVDGKADEYFQSILHRTVEDRKQAELTGRKTPSDLLHNLLTAKKAGDKMAADKMDDSTEAAGDSWDRIPKTMSYEELLGQSMLIIFAGFDTTATTLQMCCYLLAKYPDIQEKVYEEIQRVVKSDHPTYEEASQLTYMEQVINETLRLHPPAPIITRKAAETRQYNGVTIPKDAGVIIPLDLIMKDPKHFPDPEKFDPERFSDENKAARDAMSFVPFGYGPRQCIGMRLAYLELKLGLVQIVRRVRFELNERTEPTPDGEINSKFQGFVVLDKPIMLEARLRE
ncbi:probable cytochrome P450 6a14 [Physella acuta]|uniref:probable cytochrome P450 6a14 n=1 Tax=Physella acuta TaxID=109671 RepID=UPI0027DDEC72|nr:probable cytochrome P450 6a14 [Physella acuta]